MYIKYKYFSVSISARLPYFISNQPSTYDIIVVFNLGVFTLS